MKKLFVVYFICGVCFTGVIANAIEPMTCEKFTGFTHSIQERYLINEITRNKNPGAALAACIRRKSGEIREMVMESCQLCSEFQRAVAIASRKVRTKCFNDGDFDVDMDFWDDLEVPFSEIPKP